MDFVGARYKNWLLSEPYDIGMTIKSALVRLTKTTRDLQDDLRLIQRPTTAKDVIKSTRKVNKDSISNGCMMRITPIIVWMAS